ncbi:MAG TPA: LytTR family DNA-binding domain-containing protein [Mobilitalea sp.]|nr:LytTR family DNA-binding domain-containing protein [Mobilitalea sp.]
MIRVAIIEDNEIYTKQLLSYIQDYKTKKGYEIQVSTFGNGEELLFDYKPVYDIILMDIEMPKMDGMSTAKEIRKLDDFVEIIFVTNFAQYATEGYKVKAKAYVLKPINYYGFTMELQSVIDDVSKKRDHFILLSYGDGVSRVNVRDIYYVESQKHNIVIHTENGIFTMREPLKNMEKRLSGCHFEKCGISYLVSLAQVQSIRGNFAIVGKDEVPISRQKRKTFMTALTDYIGGGKSAY